MIDFKVKRNQFNMFESAVLKFDKDDIDIWVNITMGLTNKLEQLQQYLQDTFDNIKDLDNGEEYIMEIYTIEKLEQEKIKIEGEINQIKKYINILNM